MNFTVTFTPTDRVALLALLLFTMTSSPPTVAVIGGGPGSMFFCHALETRRRELMEKGDSEAALAHLPIVTCFERADGPGGVWRAERKFASAEEETRDEPSEERQDTLTNMCTSLLDTNDLCSSVSSLVESAFTNEETREPEHPTTRGGATKTTNMCKSDSSAHN